MATMQRMQTTGLELFYAKGYYNTSVDDILKKLELSKGAFYYHFDSKEDFFDRHVDCEAVATFLMSSYFGVRTLMTGSSPSAKKYRFMTQLRQYFRSIETKPVTA